MCVENTHNNKKRVLDLGPVRLRVVCDLLPTTKPATCD